MNYKEKLEALKKLIETDRFSFEEAHLTSHLSKIEFGKSTTKISYIEEITEIIPQKVIFKNHTLDSDTINVISKDHIDINNSSGLSNPNELYFEKNDIIGDILNLLINIHLDMNYQSKIRTPALKKVFFNIVKEAIKLDITRGDFFSFVAEKLVDELKKTIDTKIKKIEAEAKNLKTEETKLKKKKFGLKPKI